MGQLFSKRNAPPADKLILNIPEKARTRILAIFEDHSTMSRNFMINVEKALRKEYGNLAQSTHRGVKYNDKIYEHFYMCSELKALDFIEICLQKLDCTRIKNCINDINSVFIEHGIGYELTPYLEYKTDKETEHIKIEFPQIICRTDQYVHDSIIEPALRLLTDARLHTVNRELLKAHKALRSGEFENAITLCCSSFESFLKTICSIKEWEYSPDATCSKLISICREKELFPAYYTPIFESIGTIRNKSGDAHGRGPNSISVMQYQAEHALHVTSAHMLIVAKFAELQ